MKLFHLSTSYAFPIAVSIGLHAVLFAFVFWGWESTSTPKRVTAPKAIQATIVQLEASSPAAAAPQPAQRTIDVAAQRAEAERLAEQRRAEQRRQQAERERQERQRQEQERREKERKEQERREQERRDAERRAQEQREAEQRRLQEAIAAEMEAERASLEAEQNAAIAASYSALVEARIVRNWSRPPSARNDMVADLQIQLVPTGRVVGVTIVKSSGDPAFDRSAERAVWKAEQFPELQQLPSIVFEQQFRQFTLRFNPQDLRQ